jgi:hypothetical protein
MDDQLLENQYLMFSKIGGKIPLISLMSKRMRRNLIRTFSKTDGKTQPFGKSNEAWVFLCDTETKCQSLHLKA